MHEDDIVIRAHQVIAARRAAQIDSRTKWWMIVLLCLISLTIGSFLVYPAPMTDKLLLAMGGVCGLRPHHSYVAGGTQLPLEARMTGIYGGFMLTLGWPLLRRRLGAHRLGSWIVGSLLSVCFLSMVIDGINSTLTEMSLPHAYTSTNLGRFITGLVSGVASAVGLAWVLANAIYGRARTDRRVLIHSPIDLGAPLLACLVFGFLVVNEWAWAYYPIALLSVGGIVLALTGSVLLLLVTARRRHYHTLRQLIGLCTLAVFIALAVLAITATFRWTNSGFFA